MLGDFSTDFPNESVFEPSKVNIHQGNIDLLQSIDCQQKRYFKFSPYCDSDGQMVREFAPQSVITGSIP